MKVSEMKESFNELSLILATISHNDENAFNRLDTIVQMYSNSQADNTPGRFSPPIATESFEQRAFNGDKGSIPMSPASSTDGEGLLKDPNTSESFYSILTKSTFNLIVEPAHEETVTTKSIGL